MFFVICAFMTGKAIVLGKPGILPGITGAMTFIAVERSVLADQIKARMCKACSCPGVIVVALGAVLRVRGMLLSVIVSMACVTVIFRNSCIIARIAVAVAGIAV